MMVAFVVVMAFVIFELHRDRASRFRYRAAYVFELHRGVGDMESLLQHAVDAAEDDIAG